MVHYQRDQSNTLTLELKVDWNEVSLADYIIKNEKMLLPNTQVFNIILTEHDLNRHQLRFIHSVAVFKHSYTSIV